MIRRGSRFTDEEHRLLASHFYAVEWHVREICNILGRRLLTNVIHKLIKTTWIGKLRCRLDNDYLLRNDLPSPYFGAQGDGDEPHREACRKGSEH